jgi:hypothetical protein
VRTIKLLAEESRPRYRRHVRAISEGVLDACETYSTWCGRPSIRREVVEALISVKVAESLFSRLGPSCNVGLEVGVATIAATMRTHRRSRQFESLRIGGRVDVAFYSRGEVTGVVEVKRDFLFSKLRADVARVSALLSGSSRAGGSMRWGAVVAMLEVSLANRATIELQTPYVARRLRLDAKGCTMHAQVLERLWDRPQGDGTLGYAAVCLFLETDAFRRRGLSDSEGSVRSLGSPGKA